MLSAGARLAFKIFSKKKRKKVVVLKFYDSVNPLVSCRALSV